MMPANGHVAVPPGFRFHPTEEELLHYYLRKKVAYEAIDLDVIRDIDLNRLEPWDLEDRCKVGSGPQDEWYFFSHKDKKYPSGTRTNRATTAGFWKATGRDKAIYLSNSNRIGMRKTLVFYIGRAPRGQKTDWIMHEYRLDDDNSEIQDGRDAALFQGLYLSAVKEDGWVVCRVFKKKSRHRNHQLEMEVEEEEFNNEMKASGLSNTPILERRQNSFQMQYDFSLDNSMHLPQLLSPETAVGPFLPSHSLNRVDIECSQNLMKLVGGGGEMVQQERFSGDWSFLDKLLASHQTLDHLCQSRLNPHLPNPSGNIGASVQRFPFPYLGCEDILKYSNSN